MERLTTFKKNWECLLIDRLSALCRDTPLAHALEMEQTVGVHLAVLVEPYLGFILQGKKTIESRFSVKRQAPYMRVQNGDILVLKGSSGPVCGVCRVADVWYYQIDQNTWDDIERYSTELCMDGSAFWKKRKSASFATLMQVEQVQSLEKFNIDKRDPRAWVVIRGTSLEQQGTLL